MKNNWQTKKLAEIGTIFNGNSINEDVKKKKYLNINGGLPYIATKDIDPDLRSIDYNNGIRIPLGEKGFRIAHKGSVLICAEGGSAGKKIAQTTQDIYFGNKLFALETNGLVDPKFVFYWYLTPMFAESYKAKMRGLIGGVSMNSFKNLLIPLPPISEQKRIVKLLDRVFKKTAKAQENTQKNLQNSSKLFESYLQKIFTAQSKDCDKKKLSEICVVFADGDWIEKKDQSSEGIRLIQTGNIGRGYFKGRSEKARYISESTFKRLRCTEILPGDCLVSRLPDPVGRACLVPETDEKMITAVDCTIMRFKNNVLPKWFIAYSLSQDYQAQINKQIGGATRQRISRNNLSSIEIPIPKLSEQRIIIKKLDTLSVDTNKLGKNYGRKLSDLEEFKKSIFKMAFTNLL